MISIITKITHKNNQNKWSFLLTIMFLGLFTVAVTTLMKLGRMPQFISVFDASLIVLAVFRLTRLTVYDSVMRFFRDFFVKKETKEHYDGDLIVTRSKYQDGFRRTISDLLSCPWCIGMWLSLIISFFFFLTPYAWFFVFVLAVAGFSSLIQIAINLVGWRAEQLKSMVEPDTMDVPDEERRDVI
jgi:membrane protein YdbS with pleckstrin-like domain